MNEVTSYLLKDECRRGNFIEFENGVVSGTSSVVLNHRYLRSTFCRICVVFISLFNVECLTRKQSVVLTRLYLRLFVASVC